MLRRINMRFVAKAYLRRCAAVVSAAALSIGAVAGVLPLLGAQAAAAPGAPAVVLRSINVSKYPGVLGNSKSFSLYLLQNEAGGKLHCVGGCLQSWIPLYVAEGTRPSLGAGVKGEWGMVTRKLSNAVTKYQLTYNTYPVYTYAGDTAPRQSSGEGIKFATGVYWYLVRASATTVVTTAMTPVTGSSGGGGW
jgi:predicted lipoprotein with Yx(FWY)xxD motif